MNFGKKLIAGASERKTRLHDELGNRIDLSRLLRNGPRALITGLLRMGLDLRPATPWISYDAKNNLAKRLNKENAKALEFGSGMSTVWLASQCAHVVSVEDYQPWFEKVTKELTQRRIANVTYVYAEKESEYCTHGALQRNAPYDFILIDGSYRATCAAFAVQGVSPNGVIYLDNSDKGPGGLPGDVPLARDILRKFADFDDRKVVYYTDFAPTQLFAQQGMLILEAGSRSSQKS